MNISGLTTTPSVNNLQSSKTSGIAGDGFTKILAQLQKSQTIATAVPSAADRIAEVRSELDAETLMWLDKYAEIYTKYATLHGDDFETKNNIPDLGFSAEAASTRLKYAEITSEFRNELAEAGIPGFHKSATVEEYEANPQSYAFLTPTEIQGLRDNTYMSPIAALFYAEKYGLAGLSPEAQQKEILGGLKFSSPQEMLEAAQLLYNVGAISASVRMNLDRQVMHYAFAHLNQNSTEAEYVAAISTPRLWDDMLLGYNDFPDGQELYELLSKVWKNQQEDDDDKKLDAIFRKIDTQQEAIRDAIELSNKKRIERELLGRADAASCHRVPCRWPSTIRRRVWVPHRLF
ncbi:MAG: hypothetical protein FWH04_03215 [Oscillospiraceae bacterium]|nr:hypothetical protein [Oscillospiraceae bacterium]